jgi:3-oxoacyl-[acyl-carrier-protein] synthase-3
MLKALTGIEYVLGDQCHDFAAADGFDATDLPRKPDMWGWGSFFKSSRSCHDLAAEAAGRSMSSAGLGGEEVDVVIFCRAGGDESEQWNDNSGGKLLEAFGLANALPISVTSGGCSVMLTGIAIGASLLDRRRIRNILVVAADRVCDGERRFQRYGIFSDAASACIVSSERAEGFEIVGDAFAIDRQSMRSDASFSSDLARQVNDELLSGCRIKTSDVKQVFCNNVFVPITMLKEVEVGYDRRQIFLDNVTRTGHCYASDSMIGLADFRSLSQISPDEYFIIAADAPGIRRSMLLRSIMAGERSRSAVPINHVKVS